MYSTVQLSIVVYKTQQKLEKLPLLRVPLRPFNRSTNPEIGQLLKESNELLNVCRLLYWFTSQQVAAIFTSVCLIDYVFIHRCIFLY